jgi:hypothetical protein
MRANERETPLASTLQSSGTTSIVAKECGRRKTNKGEGILADGEPAHGATNKTDMSSVTQGAQPTLSELAWIHR